MIVGALIGGLVLAGLVLWSGGDAHEDQGGAGFAALRVIGGLGLTALAVQAIAAGAPAAAVIAGMIAVALFVAPTVNRLRGSRSTFGPPRELPAANDDRGRRAA